MRKTFNDNDRVALVCSKCGEPFIEKSNKTGLMPTCECIDQDVITEGLFETLKKGKIC